jgi:hypothetical protein
VPSRRELLCRDLRLTLAVIGCAPGVCVAGLLVVSASQAAVMVIIVARAESRRRERVRHD